MLDKKFGVLMLLLSSSIAGCATDNVDEPDLSDDVVSQAASVHLKGGARAKPAFHDEGLKLSASGDLSGLGNADVLISLNAVAQPISTCTNPAGETQPPGQNPAEVAISGSVAIPASEIKNGTLHFWVATAAPDPIVTGAPDCPNTQWTERITDMSFLSGTITVEQPVGTTVFGVSCTFSPATQNGVVPGAQVTCTTN
jgi:hypothetical protein